VFFIESSISSRKTLCIHFDHGGLLIPVLNFLFVVFREWCK